jgi:gliding motility-associated lipoprotein GldH
MKTKTLIAFLMVLLMSCHEYKKYEKEPFKNYSWASNASVIFNPVIDDISKEYKLLFGIRHLYGFQLNTLSVSVTTITPSGVQSQQDFAFKIKDDAGKYIGKCAGDMCDLETVVIDNFKFEEAGRYSFIISHNIQTEKLPGVMEFGLIIDEK